MTPTRRLAHHLRARHDETCLAAGLDAWVAPDVLPWDEFIARAFARDRSRGGSTGRWLPGIAALLVWERIIREDPELDPMMSPAGLARVAAQSWRRAHDHDIPLDALAVGGSPECVAFARWSQRYAAMLAERGWTDAATAAARIRPDAVRPGFELVGFDRLTPLQQRVVDTWRASGVEVVRRSEAGGRATASRITCVDPAAEFEAAARWAAQTLHEGDGLRQIAIVVPDLDRRREQVRRIVARTFAPASGLTGGPATATAAFEFAAAPPLSEQPVVAAGLLVLESCLGEPDLPRLSRLLRLPFIDGAAAERAARARLDVWLRRSEGPGLTLGRLERLATERGCPLLGAALARARSTLQKWSHKEFPSDCSDYVLRLLSDVGWPGGDLDSEEHQAEQRWRALVMEFGRNDDFTGRMSPTEAVARLRELTVGTLFEPRDQVAPLLVIDTETSAGMRFDALWLTGLDASNWPPAASPDPLLPRTLQVRHGVPQASAGLAMDEARARFERLLRSAGTVYVSHALREDDTPLLPSPLLDALPSASVPAGWSEPRVAAWLYAGRPRLESGVDPGLPPLSAAEARRGGAQLLQLQSACPLRAQVELRLGARPLDVPSIGVDSGERGDLLHTTLAALWRGLPGQAALAELDDPALQSRVQEAVDGALAEARRRSSGLTAHLLDLEARWLVRRVLEILECEKARPPFEVESLETARSLLLGPLRLEVRPDRVDRLADGSLVVIDYKTGANADVAAWLEERPSLPQLPAYVHALGADRVAGVAFARVRTGDTGYAGLASRGHEFTGLAAPGDRAWPPGVPSWEVLLADWRRRLEHLASEHASGSVRLAPDPPHACRYCHLGGLCRIGEAEESVAAGEGT